MQLKIEYLSKNDLKPYVNNAKIHTDGQVEQIRKSIEEFDFNDPIAVWGENEIVEGHGRLLAAMEMDDIETVPVIRLDHLTDKQRKAYALAHNKLTMNTDFDIDKLADEMSEIGSDIDLTDFGFELQTELIEDIKEKELDEEMEKEVKGEVKFAEYIDEVSQYVVLKFKNERDWAFINNVLGLEKVKQYSTRKDGGENGMQKTGLGRVVDGMQAVKKIEENYKLMMGDVQ